MNELRSLCSSVLVVRVALLGTPEAYPQADLFSRPGAKIMTWS
ncbi:MAG: hypothetical protein AB1714_00800 [Acidobacteriota bacterium]